MNYSYVLAQKVKLGCFRESVPECHATCCLKSLGGGVLGWRSHQLSQVIHMFWWAPFRHPGLPLPVTWQPPFPPSVSTPSSPTHAVASRSLISILWSLSSFQPNLENQCIKISFPFLPSMLIRLSRILLPNTRRCTKSWPNPWPQFSSLPPISSPATNYLRYVGRASVALWYWNWRKFRLHGLMDFTLFVCFWRQSPPPERG